MADNLKEIKVDASAKDLEDLINKPISTNKIANGAVTTDKIARSAVTTDKLAGSAVTTVKIADGAVTTDEIKNNAVTAEKLADGSVTADKLDREYMMLAPYVSMSGSMFHNYLKQYSTDDFASNKPYKTLFAFGSRGDGILATVEAGRCVGMFGSSSIFRIWNLTTGKSFEVVFNDERIESVTQDEGGAGTTQVIVDQTFNPDSENAQSGKAVAQAIETALADIEATLDGLEDLLASI